MNQMTPIPQNYKNSVNWILGAYTDAGVSFPEGFQKDAIQNAVGARKTNKFKNWRCDISVVSTSKGLFVVIEDTGTVGLTGKNTPAEEINDMMAKGIALPSSERLSRFSSMFNSGGNETGGGLFGAGKSVYSVASKSYTYYFDSVREDGSYVANINKCGQVMSKALEDEEAKNYIFNNTGLQKKESVGTRIIIVSPQEELVQSIISEEIISFIQESWWLTISKMDDGSCISINGKPVDLPEGVKNATHVFELKNPETYIPNYKVKHFGLYVFEDGKNIWKGISYYRKGMKIGEVELKDIPVKVEGKFWGYIEVDEAWEAELADIEDKVHFGVSKGKKKTITYQHLKNYCNERFKANLTEWGYIKDKEREDQKLRDELQQIAEELQDLFDNLGFEDLGKGPQKADFDIRWQDIVYPVENTEKVTTDDEIKFSMRIKSNYATDKRFDYKLYVYNPKTGKIISQIINERITVRSNSVEKSEFTHKVTKENSEQYAENRIILSVKVVGSGREKVKELPFFYDIDRPDNSKNYVDLSLHECEFPVKGSRRVNFGESIKNISFRIDNKRNHILNYRLNVSIHNATDPTFPKIMDITSIVGEVKPFEDVVTDKLEEIIFFKEVYERYLSSGILELRARLVANEDDEEFEKGDKITAYKYKIFLNMDEKNGKKDAFDIKSVDAPDNYKRSWIEEGKRVINFNVGHIAYLNVKEYPELQHEYLREQMLKQYVLLYLAEGKYDVFGEQGRDFAELEPQEAAERVIEKIEDVYYRSLI